MKWPLAMLCIAAVAVAGIGLSWPRVQRPALVVEAPPFLNAKPRQTYPLRFSCRNESAETIRIVGMRAICTTAGCASSDALPLEIAPGARQDLAVEFSAPLEGEFEYPLTLYYEQDGFRSITVPIRGMAKKFDVGAYSRVREVGELRQGAVRVEDVDVVARSSGRIAQWRTSCECVTIEPSSLDAIESEAATVRATIDMSKDDFVGGLGVLCEGVDESGQVLAEFELRFDIVR